MDRLLTQRRISAPLSGAVMFAFSSIFLSASSPVNDPTVALKLPWTGTLKWSHVVSITDVQGDGPDMKLENAQQKLAAEGGGVVFFPAGEYVFKSDIRLKDGIVLRGAPPAGETDARKDGYAPASRLVFPKYEFKADGKGTSNETAFKAVLLENPATASNCGVVDLAIHRGHVLFSEDEAKNCGKNRIVYGCLLTSTAYPYTEVPSLKNGQKPWQRYTHPFGAAIDAKSKENLLIANNRLPVDGQDNFTMNGYVLFDRKRQPMEIDGVVFDYDNRAGIYANHYSLGGPGGSPPDDTPETNPDGFRKGTVIHQNYVKSTGRCAIGFAGDGVVCSDNVIRFVKDVWRPTPIGTGVSAGASTNDNRAVEMRGWRWKVTGNDYEVFSNLSYDRVFHYNDGEGLMHEDHCNSTIKDSVLTGNKGNRYLSLFWTGGIDGLLVADNDIRPDQAKDPAIWVSSNRVGKEFPIRNVTIRNNRVKGGIHIAGAPGENNLVSGNEKVDGGTSEIQNFANAKVESNQGFTVITERPVKKKK